mgnify:CR=1 FL=1
MTNKIKIIDLFAGPGGLGEGFSNFKKNSPFSIAMSVEKEISAHATLTLRSFLRKFKSGKYPLEYYEYIRESDKKKKPALKEVLKERYAEEWAEAEVETLGGPRALGTEDNELIFDRLEELKHQHKGPWLVIGGPPCQAYSLAGRSRNMGIDGYDAKEDHRHFLYKEYIGVLNTIEPDVFVMENVKGILSAKVDGVKMFPKILEDLKQPSQIDDGNITGPRYKIYSLVTPPESMSLLDDPTYKNPSDFIIRTEDYGIPQSRHRVILLGIKEGVKTHPKQLKIKLDKVTVHDMIGSMPKLRSGLSKEEDTPQNWKAAVEKAHDKLATKLPKKQRDVSEFVKTLKNSSFPESRGGLFCKSTASGFSKSANNRESAEDIVNWIKDPLLEGFANHETKTHMTSDLARYLFCSAWSKTGNESPSPKSADFPAALAPDHANWRSGAFADRFRCQVADRPSTTITSHIAKDGHYFIHPDPLQCRSLTVREAARLQTFPDNYYFEGNKTQQYVQVGNAVPPYLAKQIAGIVFKLIK